MVLMLQNPNKGGEVRVDRRTSYHGLVARRFWFTVGDLQTKVNISPRLLRFFEELPEGVSDFSGVAGCDRPGF